MSTNANYKTYLKVKDHSVSGESFDLVQHSEQDLLETRPQPSEEKLSQYYNSDDYISHTDTKRNWFEKLYHLVRSVALKRKLNLISAFASEEKKLLDFGCGTGDFLKVAQEHGWDVLGIEPSSKARAIANQKTKEAVFDKDKLFQFKKKQFDVITLWHVLEHLPNLELHLNTFEALLKPNGTLIIAVPNYKSYDALHYKEFWAAYDVPRHLWHFSQEGMSRILNLAKMEVVDVKPMVFDAFYVSLLSEKYKSNSMKLFSAFWTGWRSNIKARQSGEYSSLIYVIERSKTTF